MSMMKNAVESIQIGMEDFHTEDPRRLLSAIRNLYAGILLLFKCKLQELSPEGSKEALLKTKILPVIDEATGQATWIGKGKRTVEVRDIIERLESLGIDGVEWRRLESLQSIRNDIEHYYSQLPEERMKEAIADALHLITQFCEPHLGDEPAEILGQECWEHMLGVATIYDEELNACRENLSSVSWPFSEVADSIGEMRCPHCDSQLIKTVDTSAQDDMIEFICSSCRETAIYSEVVGPAVSARLSLSHRDIVNGSDPQITECPGCGEETFLILRGQCAACFEEQEHFNCTFCEEPLSLDEQHLGGLCGYCSHKYEKMMAE